VTSRRAFIRTAGLALLAAPAGAAAQSGSVHQIGFLGGASAPGYANLVDSLRGGLRDRGLVEGKNITIHYRWAEGKYERLAALAGELVRLKVKMIITQGTPAAVAAKQATQTIPIVMAIVGSPVESGVVASYARPGANITGSSFFMDEVNAKRLEFLKVLNPNLTRAGLLVNADNPAIKILVRTVEERAHALKVEVRTLSIRSMDALSAALDSARKEIEALTVWEDGLFVANARRIADLAASSRLPSIGFREYCDAGGLLAYGVDFPYIWRESAALVEKILLRGAKPSDLPIQQATRFELVVNLRTAKAFGLKIPASLLTRADAVIE
jgi:putative tryptophan/tyrosine transport system substrate-binding protein